MLDHVALPTFETSEMHLQGVKERGMRVMCNSANATATAFVTLPLTCT